MKEDKFELVPMDLIDPSLTNTRSNFNNAHIDELAKSIEQYGLIQPIILREINDRYEIVAGERRFRAFQKLALKEIPSIIRDLTADAAFEVQIIENLQRKDIHPMDESVGFVNLSKKISVETIAAKLGKSERYIYRRIHLQKLTEQFQKAFYEDKINLGHALLLCRMTEKDQDKLFSIIVGDERSITVNSLKNLIKRDYMLNLAKAPWDKEDVKLVTESGSCVMCDKRTGYMPELFSEYNDSDICTDVKCFENKKKAFIDFHIKKAADEGRELVKIINGYSAISDVLSNWEFNIKEGKGRPPKGKKVVDAIYVGLEEVGKIVRIIIDDPGQTESSAAQDQESADPKEIERENIDNQRLSELKKVLFNQISKTFIGNLSKEDLLFILKHTDLDTVWGDAYLGHLERAGITLHEIEEKMNADLIPKITFYIMENGGFALEHAPLDDFKQAVFERKIDVEKAEKEIEEKFPYPEEK